MLDQILKETNFFGYVVKNKLTMVYMVHSSQIASAYSCSDIYVYFGRVGSTQLKRKKCQNLEYDLIKPQGFIGESGKLFVSQMIGGKSLLWVVDEKKGKLISKLAEKKNHGLRDAPNFKSTQGAHQHIT
ncbi:hypothetical protein QUF70_10485 [Desulfobacterales bacterium HSG17]|nr:hypothetical protein [Desulfobacterales bacterium HSG17]